MIAQRVGRLMVAGIIIEGADSYRIDYVLDRIYVYLHDGTVWWTHTGEHWYFAWFWKE